MTEFYFTFNLTFYFLGYPKDSKSNYDDYYNEMKDMKSKYIEIYI